MGIDDEIAEFHRTAARRQRRISGLAGVIMLLLGTAIMSLSVWLEAPPTRVGSKWGSVIVGGLIAFRGVLSLVRFVRNK